MFRYIINIIKKIAFDLFVSVVVIVFLILPSLLLILKDKNSNPIELFVNDVVVCEIGDNKLPGLIVETPINSKIYNGGKVFLPRFKATIKKLSDNWKLLPQMDLERWEAESEKFELCDPTQAVLLSNSNGSDDVQQVQVGYLEEGCAYHLKFFLVLKEAPKNSEESAKLITEGKRLLLNCGDLCIREYERH